MKKRISSMVAVCLVFLLATPVYAALPESTGMITSCSAVSGSEFSPNSAIAAKLDKMFAGDIGLFKDKNKTKPVDAALGTRNVPNNGVWQYWGPEPRAGTSCFAYANAFYCTFYDGVYPHHEINSNHQKVKATGRISYENFVKWGVRDDAPVYIREGNHSIIVLHYDENYITYVDGNGDARGLIAIRKEAWQRGSGANMYNQKPSLIVQPTTDYFPAGKMQVKPPVPCTEGGTYHKWDKGTVAKVPSCKETGLKVYTCSACQKTKESAISKTTDHTYGKWELTKEATIFSAGVRERTCSLCGKVKKGKTDCSFRDETFGITLTTKEGVFPKNTQILLSAPEEISVEYETLQLTLQDVTGKISPYHLQAQAKEKPVAPKGEFTLELTVPEGFGNNLALYLVTDEAVQALEAAFDAEKKTMTVALNHIGMLVLCDLDVPWEPVLTEPTEIETQPETVPETQPQTQPETQQTVAATEEKAPIQVTRDMYILLFSAAAVLLVGCVTIIITVIVKKRKKTAMPEEVPEDAYV